LASRGKKLAIGCGVGCLGLAVLSVAGCVTFVSWLNRPGELLEPEKLLGRDTTAYVEWTLRVEDPGTRAFVERLIELTQQDPAASGFPPLLQGLISRNNRKNEESIRELLPAVAAWTLRPADEQDEDLHLITLSIERFGNRMRLADWFIGMALARDADAEVLRHGDEKIYFVPIGGGDGERERAITFFIRGNDLFFTSDPDTATIAVDRLVGDETDSDLTHTPSSVETLFAAIPQDRPLRGVIDNDRGELGRVWEMLSDTSRDASAEDRLWDSFRAVSLAGGFSNNLAFDGTLTFWCNPGECSDDNSTSLVRRLRAEYERGHLAIETRSSVHPDHIRVDVHVPDLLEFIDQAIN